MGGRGRWAGGADSQAVRSWDYDRRDESDRDSEVPTDWHDQGGDQVFRWVGMTDSQARTYFEKNIKPFADFYVDGTRSGYEKAASSMDRYIIDDYQLGKYVQGYREHLASKVWEHR